MLFKEAKMSGTLPLDGELDRKLVAPQFMRRVELRCIKMSTISGIQFSTTQVRARLLGYNYEANMLLLAT
jgi:hypothetical protein